MCVWCLRRSEEGVRCPGAGALDSCEHVLLPLSCPHVTPAPLFLLCAEQLDPIPEGERRVHCSRTPLFYLKLVCFIRITEMVVDTGAQPVGGSTALLACLRGAGGLAANLLHFR